MKNVLVIASLVIFSCNVRTKMIEGDLYFKLIDFQRFFDLPDSALTKIEADINGMNLDTLPRQDKEVYKLLQYMSDQKLIRQPFVRLLQDNGAIAMVFIDSADFEKLKVYNRKDLVNEHKKVRIKTTVSELKYDTLIAYRSLQPISFNKIEGITYWKK